MARLLRPFGIVSATRRLDTGTAKGYAVETFADAFARYLPGFYPSQRHNPALARVVTESASVTADSVLRIDIPSQPSTGEGFRGKLIRNTTDRVTDL